LFRAAQRHRKATACDGTLDVFGALIGRHLLGERDRVARMAGSTIIVFGVRAVAWSSRLNEQSTLVIALFDVP
jgi:hypothetical protein